MSTNTSPDFGLHIDILQTLERLRIPYVIIGAFAATIYGISRPTYDIDIIVDFSEKHIEGLVRAYPPPRFYADPVQIRESIRLGIMFNIIDTERGEKADLMPLSMAPYFRMALQHRLRERVEMTGYPPFDIWVARPEDIIIGKLTAWDEGRSRKHEMDIYQMLVFLYLHSEESLDERRITRWAERLGPEAYRLWGDIQSAARREVIRLRKLDDRDSLRS